jgi:hypothetical protein
MKHFNAGIKKYLMNKKGAHKLPPLIIPSMKQIPGQTRNWIGLVLLSTNTSYFWLKSIIEPAHFILGGKLINPLGLFNSSRLGTGGGDAYLVLVDPIIKI